VALLLLPDAVVVGVLTPAAATVVAGMEPFAASALRVETQDLMRLVRGHLEEASSAAVEHDGQQPAELLFYRCQLSHQRSRIHRQAGSVDYRQWQRFEQSEALAREDGQPLAVRKVAGDTEELLYPTQIPGDLLRNLPLQSQPGQCLERRFDPVLHLDQVLPPAAIARLQLQITGDNPMLAGPDMGEPLNDSGKGRAAGRRPAIPALPAFPSPRLFARGKLP
jgi:hypothetical protein